MLNVIKELGPFGNTQAEVWDTNTQVQLSKIGKIEITLIFWILNTVQSFRKMQ